MEVGARIFIVSKWQDDPTPVTVVKVTEKLVYVREDDSRIRRQYRKEDVYEDKGAAWGACLERQHALVADAERRLAREQKKLRALADRIEADKVPA